MNLIFVFAIATMTPEAPFEPPAQSVSEHSSTAARYEACTDLAATNAEEARQYAGRWLTEGGGISAHHCLAIADLAAGSPALAAIRLTEISERDDAGGRLDRSKLLGQAARAWLEAGEPEQAGEAISAAFKKSPELLTPDESLVDESLELTQAAPAQVGQLHLTAAAIFAANERWQATIDAVTVAEENGVSSEEGYVNRARAYQALSKPSEAAEDVVAALEINPFNLDALVLRGELLQAGVEIKANYARKNAE